MAYTFLRTSGVLLTVVLLLDSCALLQAQSGSPNSVTAFGARGDAASQDDGIALAGSKTSTSQSATFSTEDHGKLIGTRLPLSGSLAQELLPPPRPGLQRGPDRVPFTAIGKSVLSKFIVGNWCSDDARRFQSVDEINILLSCRLRAYAPLLLIR